MVIEGRDDSDASHGLSVESNGMASASAASRMVRSNGGGIEIRRTAKGEIRRETRYWDRYERGRTRTL